MRRESIAATWFVGLGLLLSGCGGQPSTDSAVDDVLPPEASPSRVAATDDPAQAANTAAKREFLAVAERICVSQNPYLGEQQLPQLSAALRRPNLRLEEKVNLLLQQTWHELRLGRIESAQVSIGQAFGEVASGNGSPTASMFKLRALVHLRQAEYQNCVKRHNHECCVFPLRGGGVHTEKVPMQEARKDLLAWLARSPREIEAAWLLNLTAMALGDFPEGVPATYRLPPEAFPSEGPIRRFIDIAPRLGVDTFNLCGGAIVEDFNGDDILDIVTSTYDPRGSMSYYEGNGLDGFRDRSEASGLSQQLGGLNCLAADHDNDGDMDILVLRGAWLGDDGRIRNSLLSNDGHGNFHDVTRSAGLDLPAYPTQAAAWADFDNDGHLDLFIGNESRRELAEPGGDFPSQLFRNRGDGTFADVAQQAGVTNDRYCKGVAAGDYDNDGDMDLYVSNRGPNRLYRNNGDGTFTDVAAQAGVLEPQQQSFASWFFDYDNDGWLDLFVAAYQATNADVAADHWGLAHQGVPPCLYRNLANGTFANVTTQVGLDHPYLPMGANFGDLDNDGFLDIYLTTGRPDFAALMPNEMLRNDRGQRFQNVTSCGGFGHLQKGHGIAFADLDNDGDQDIYHQLGGFYPGDKFHNALFCNPGHPARFLHVKLTGSTGHRQAIGARLRITAMTARGPLVVHRAVGSVSSFGGSPNRQEIGLGQATAIEELRVIWPVSGAEQIVHDVPCDTFIEITEGEPGFVKHPLRPIEFAGSVRAEAQVAR